MAQALINKWEQVTEYEKQLYCRYVEMLMNQHKAYWGSYRSLVG